MLAYGDSSLEQMSQEYLAARIAEREAMARLTGAMIWSSLDGMAQTEIAERTGVMRATVRKALGL